MKILFLIFLFNNLLFSFEPKSDERLSPITKLFLNDKIEYQLEKLKKRYLIYTINSQDYIGALLLLNENYDQANFEKLSCIIGAKVGNILSIKIPLNNFDSFVKLQDFDYFQFDEKIGLSLDKALEYSNENDAFYNLVIQNKFNYRECIVGVIDIGFHFRHPMFYEDNKNKIEKIWLQNISNTSLSKPRRYAYGVEFSPNDANSYLFDTDQELHGSHVAGIAAGSRFSASSKIIGVAPKSKLLLVSPIFNFDDFITTGHSNILDAVKYIFDYADSKGKPAVINLSLGHNIGPHDGSAIFDQAINQLSGPGHIVVTSAGNNRIMKCTVYRDFDINPAPLKTGVTAYRTSDGSILSYVDLWNLEGESFCVKVGIYKNNLTRYGEIICSDYTSFNSEIITLADFRIRTKVVSSDTEFNDASRLFLEFEVLSSSGEIFLEITSDKGKVFAWHCGIGGSQAGDFRSNSTLGLVSGTNTYQISEIAGNADSSITVASYNTRSDLKNFYGYEIASRIDIRDISEFSSKGPAANDNQKPDITAPGSTIVSAFNPEFVKYFSEKTTNPVVEQTTFQGREYHVGSLSGTSMSSPFVAGVVSLMFSVNPFLGPNDIKEILRITALNDFYTGDIKDTGDDSWGYGKVNIYEAMEIAQSKFEDFNVSPYFSYYPNPVKDNLIFEFEKNSLAEATITLTDLNGRIYLNDIKINPYQGIQILPLSFLAPGFYIVNMKYNNEIHTFNIIKGIN